jgi:hypothetical protein
MKRYLILFILLFFIQSVTNASLYDEQTIQTRVDNVAYNILNKNKITERIVFVYDKNEKKRKLSLDKTLTQRQVILYDGLYQHIQTDDELAAMLSREISTAIKSYKGIWGGTIDSIQVALGSKKFETVADKRAVDYMVRAGYNPLALIVYINKTCPQRRQDRFSRHNLTSKRLAGIYEYITYKYPDYINSGSYVNNKYYQNFLLNSVSNRAKLDIKIKTGSKKELSYE